MLTDLMREADGIKKENAEPKARRIFAAELLAVCGLGLAELSLVWGDTYAEWGGEFNPISATLGGWGFLEVAAILGLVAAQAVVVVVATRAIRRLRSAESGPYVSEPSGAAFNVMLGSLLLAALFTQTDPRPVGITLALVSLFGGVIITAVLKYPGGGAD